MAADRIITGSVAAFYFHKCQTREYTIICAKFQEFSVAGHDKRMNEHFIRINIQNRMFIHIVSKVVVRI